MAKLSVRPGAIIDGFTIGECVHSGGMATLWSVTRPDISAPLLMKIPRVSVRDDPRSDLFSLGVLLYFFTTGVRPFGEGETMRAMRRRLWRDPHPPRKLKADYPPWLQEIVLRCLEIEPVWRYPTASQLAFELAHPDQIKLTARSERLQRDPISTVWRRRFNRGLTQPKAKADLAAQLASSPIVAIAIDLSLIHISEPTRRTPIS